MSMSEEEYLTLRIDLAKAEASLEQEERRAREKQSAQRVAVLRKQLAELDDARRGGAALLVAARGLRPQVERQAEIAFALRLKIAVVAGQLAEAGRAGNRERKEELTAALGELVAGLAAPHGAGRGFDSQLQTEVQRWGLKVTNEEVEARALAGLADSRWGLPGDELPNGVRDLVGLALGKADQYHRP